MEETEKVKAHFAAFFALSRPGLGIIFIAPFRGASPTSPEQWIQVNGDTEDNIAQMATKRQKAFLPGFNHTPAQGNG